PRPVVPAYQDDRDEWIVSRREEYVGDYPRGRFYRQGLSLLHPIDPRVISQGVYHILCVRDPTRDGEREVLSHFEQFLPPLVSDISTSGNPSVRREDHGAVAD